MKNIKVFFFILMFLMTAVEGYAEGTWTTYINSNIVSDIAIDGDYLWCATKGGVVRWDTRDNTYKKYYTSDGLPDCNIDHIAIGPDGDVWCGRIAGKGKGISSFDGERWTSYTVEDGLDYNNVTAIAIEPDGDLLCAAYVWLRESNYYSVALSRFDGETWTTFTPDDGFGNRFVSSISVDNYGSVWCATRGNGIYRYDGERWIQYTTDNGLGNNDVSVMTIAPDGDIWCGSYTELSKFNGQEWTIFPTILPYWQMNSIAVGADGNVWCGIYNGGVIRFDGEQWTRYTVENGLIDNYVNAIAIGLNGDVWCGTNSDLSKYDGDFWSSHTTERYFADHLMWSVAIAPDGDAWFGTTA